MNANRGRLGVPPSISFAACTDPPYTALFSDMVRSYDDLVGALLDNGGWGQGRVGQGTCESGYCCLPAPAVTAADPPAPQLPLAAKGYIASGNMVCLPACLPGVQGCLSWFTLEKMTLFATGWVRASSCLPAPPPACLAAGVPAYLPDCVVGCRAAWPPAWRHIAWPATLRRCARHPVFWSRPQSPWLPVSLWLCRQQAVD